MGRAMPVECPHGKILDWGDFGNGPPEECEVCTNQPKHRILWNRRGEDIDEIVIDHPEMVHVEQLSDRCWWIGIYIAGPDRWSGHFSCDSRGRMVFTEQDCDVQWDKDESHEERDAKTAGAALSDD